MTDPVGCDADFWRQWWNDGPYERQVAVGDAKTKRLAGANLLAVVSTGGP